MSHTRTRLLLIPSLMLSLLVLHANSQDSLHKAARISFSGSFWGMKINQPNNAAVIVPDQLQARRTAYNQGTTNPGKTISDNPLQHGAMYAALHTKMEVTKSIHLHADLYAEHRGISYGVYSKNSISIYPVLKLDIDDSITIFRQRLSVRFDALNLLNEKLDNGLYIYNIDLQGAKLRLSTGNTLLEASMYGDLSNGIGLKIDDIFNAKIQQALGAFQTVGLSASVVTLNAVVQLPDTYLNMLYNFKKSKYTAYVQLGLRPWQTSGSTNMLQKLALLAGFSYNISGKKQLHTITAEARYYGSVFNINRFEESLRFRNASGSTYDNTVGRFLYPLRKYTSGYSQWAVYTENQGANVYGLNLSGHSSFQAWKKTEATIDYDLNYIIADYSFGVNHKQTVIYYPFFTIGYYYKPVKNFKMGVILTNKGMNLDLSYPTLYMYKSPYLGFELSAGIF